MSHIQVYEACDDFEPVVERLNGFLEQVNLFFASALLAYLYNSE